MDIIRTMN